MRLFNRIWPAAAKKKEAELHEQAIARLVAYLDQNTLSTIPTILAKVMQLAKDPRAGATEYARVCEMDQSSCMRILRNANSVYYGPIDGATIRTVKDAIVRIGFQQAQELIKSCMVAGVFKIKGTIGAYSASALWLNSVAVAVGNRTIYATFADLPMSDVDPYLSGLLCNVGIPLLHLCFFNDGFKAAVEAQQAHQSLLCEEEQRLLGVTHSDAGMEIARRWKLSDELCGVIGQHHHAVPDAKVEQLVHVTRVSQWIAFELGFGYSDFTQRHADFYLPSRERLLLIDQHYDRVKTQIQSEVERMKTAGWFAGFGTFVQSA